MSAAALDLIQLLADAEDCVLTNWEDAFCDGLRARVALYGNDVYLSAKQVAALRKIEAKVYAT